jgi:hypothetical protein
MTFDEDFIKGFFGGIITAFVLIILGVMI